jgi:hypothetical protein
VAPSENRQAALQHELEASCPLTGAPTSLEPANLLAGGPLQDDEKRHIHTDFPNQAAGKNECGPVAVSNSLEWLNTVHNLGLAADAISVARLKTILQWTAENGVDDGWISRKTDYTKQFGIETITVSPADIDKLPAYMDRHCDIELQLFNKGQSGAGGHIAAVVGLFQHKGKGKWTIFIGHDVTQGLGNQPHKPITEIVTFGVNGQPPRTLTGGATLSGKTVKTFVVECVKRK